MKTDKGRMRKGLILWFI